MNYKNKQQDFQIAITNNDIDAVKILLKDYMVNPIYNGIPLLLSIESGNIEIIKLLLKDKRMNPCVNKNYAIRVADEIGNFNVINLLWKDVKIKKTLEEDNLELYNKLNISGKINNF